MVVVGVAVVGFMGWQAPGSLGQQETPQQQGMPGQKMGEQKGMPDQRFVTEAAAGSMAEVELGKLAAGKAQNDEVKQFGQRMVTDHGKANEQLTALAKQKGYTLPKQLRKKEAASREHLQGLSGAEFDRAYMQHMLVDHERDVKLFENEAKQGLDADLKAWAAKQVPILQEHLKMARQVAAKVGAGKPAGEKK